MIHVLTHDWQWSASTGCDAQPYFRVFNPWLQQKKFDPECVYIKKWIPELVNLTTKQIHDIETNPLDSSIDYPRPMVIHKEDSSSFQTNVQSSLMSSLKYSSIQFFT